MKIKRNSRKLSRLNGILLRNPLLTMGCFLALAVVPVSSLRSAVAITLLISLISVPAYVLMSVIGKHLKGVWRAVSGPILSAVFFVPAFLLTQAAFPDIGERFGLYLPLIVFDVFFTSRCTTLAPRLNPIWSLVDSLSCCFGLGLAFCIIGCIRELFGSGTLWGMTLYYGETVPALLLPFGGFFVLACVMAFGNLLSRLVRRMARDPRPLNETEAKEE